MKKFLVLLIVFSLVLAVTSKLALAGGDKVRGEKALGSAHLNRVNDAAGW